MPEKHSFLSQNYSFSVNKTGFYAITVEAKVSKKDDLRMEIDGRIFRELPPEKYFQKFNIPPSWNGAKLHNNKSQINIFILDLKAGTHIINFITKKLAPNIINWNYKKIDDLANIVFDLNLQAQNLDHQPLLNIILIDLPIYSIKADVELNWRSKLFFCGDGDDIKLIVDGSIITDNSTKWLWRASPVRNTSKKIENKLFDEPKIIDNQKKIYTKLSPGVHYLEFVADCSPIIKKLTINISGEEEIYKKTKALNFHGGTVLDRNYYLCIYDLSSNRLEGTCWYSNSKDSNVFKKIPQFVHDKEVSSNIKDGEVFGISTAWAMVNSNWENYIYFYEPNNY